MALLHRGAYTDWACACVCLGQIDPDKMGSGIQYGELRKMGPKPGAPANDGCAC
jgi:hypothetical protein